MTPVEGAPRPEAGPQTATLALRGATWTTFGIGLQRAVQTGALIVLARLLSPEDFGLVAVAGLFLSLTSRVKSLGLQTALVQHRDRGMVAANTIFWINGAITAAAVVVLAAASPLASLWFGDPRAGAVLAVMGLRLLPQAAASVPSTLAARRLDFRSQALITLAEGLVTAGVAITLASLGWGVWALVTGSIAGAVAAAVLWWVRPPWRPWLAVDREIAGELLHAAVRIWSAANLAYLIDSANRLFVGGFLGVEVLGFYEVTTRLIHLPLQSLVGIHDRVALPAFCREQDDLQRLGRWFLRLTSFMLLVSACAAGLVFFYAEVLVPVVFGARWLAVVGAARALAPLALVMPLLSLVPVYVATDNAGLLMRLTAVRAIATVAALLVAAQFSLIAVCVVESAAAVLFVPVNLHFARRMVGLSSRALLRMVALPAVGLTAFAAAAVLLRATVGEVGAEGGWMALAAPVPALLAFAAGVFLARPSILDEVREVAGVAVGVRAYPEDDRRVEGPSQPR